MLSALRHATDEAFAAAALAANGTSKRRVALDFIASRLLKHFRLPNYNAARCLALDGLKVNYRFNRGDLQSLKEVLIDRAYEVPLPFQPRTILDLGANIGLASLWLWQKHRPERIIAVEPEPGNAEVAGRNFKDNSLPGKVVRAAVGISNGTARLSQRAESNLGEILLSDASFVGETIEVPVTGISELIARFGNGGVDLVKMDIEGGEDSLLGGDIGWLENVRALVVEFHDDRVDSARLIERVKSAGFTHSLANKARQENLSLFVRKEKR